MLTRRLWSGKVAEHLSLRMKAHFGIITEYNEREVTPNDGGIKVEEKANFFVSASRPGNFGDHIDFKANIDNWFEDNRVHNQHDDSHRRSQFYVLNAMYYAMLLNMGRLSIIAGLGRLYGLKRYDRNTYMEVDISQIPPGEVLQVSWNGKPIFVRRLTDAEYQNQMSSDKGCLDKSGEVIVCKGNGTYVLVCSALCTHLGCIPIPYLGAYNGWVCICHGSVYDKFGRVRQGPATINLPMINNTAYENGNLLCIEAMKFPHEPSELYWT